MNQQSDWRRELAVRTRRRFLFSGFTLSCYFLFVLNWSAAGGFLRHGIAGTPITGGLVMFAVLVVGFLLLELLFLRVTGVGLRKPTIVPSDAGDG